MNRKRETSTRVREWMRKNFDRINSRQIKQVDIVNLSGMSTTWVSDRYIELKNEKERGELNEDNDLYNEVNNLKKMISDLQAKLESKNESEKQNEKTGNKEQEEEYIPWRNPSEPLYYQDVMKAMKEMGGKELHYKDITKHLGLPLNDREFKRVHSTMYRNDFAKSSSVYAGCFNLL